MTLPILATDPTTPTPTYSASGLPAGLSINATTGVISGAIAPGAAVQSPYTVTVAATDAMLSSSVTFTWTVTPYVVVTPLASQSNLEGDNVSLRVQATDGGGRTLYYSADNLPPSLTIDGTGLISGRIATGASAGGPYTVTVTVTDNTYTSRQVIGWIVRHGNNQPPVLTNPGNQGNTEADPVSLQMVASDPDGDRLTYGATGLPDGLTIDPYSGVISGTLTAVAAAHSPYTVNVGVDDGNGGSASQTFTWMVNDASLNGHGLPVSANEGAPADGVTLATFLDANPYSQPGDFSVSINWGDGSPVDAGTVTLSARVYSVLGSHIYLHPGTFTVTATVTDTGGSTVQTTSTATVAVAPLTARGIDVPLVPCLPPSCQTDPTPGFQVAAFIDANRYEPASSYHRLVRRGLDDRQRRGPARRLPCLQPRSALHRHRAVWLAVVFEFVSSVVRDSDRPLTKPARSKIVCPAHAWTLFPCNPAVDWLN